jgi:hypothetical protein
MQLEVFWSRVHGSTGSPRTGKYGGHLAGWIESQQTRCDPFHRFVYAIDFLNTERSPLSVRARLIVASARDSMTC